MLTHTAPLPLFNTLSPLPAPSPSFSLGAAAGWPNLAKVSVIWGNREFRESVGGARRFPLPLPPFSPLPPSRPLPLLLPGARLRSTHRGHTFAVLGENGITGIVRGRAPVPSPSP